MIPVPAPRPGPTPTPPRALAASGPVAVAIAAIARQGQIGYAAAIADGGAITGLLRSTKANSDKPSVRHRDEGRGLWAALEALLDHEDLAGRTLDLYVESDAHRRVFVEMGAAMPRLRVHAISGHLTWVAHRAAQAHLPDLLEPPVVPGAVTAWRLTVATDGSVGGVNTQAVTAGCGWVATDGRFGYSTCAVRRPLDAELLAIRGALRAFDPAQRLLLLCDSQDAVRVVKHMLDGQLPGTLNLTDAQVKIATTLAPVLAGRDLRIEWVKAHAGHPLNECADRLAVGARRSAQLEVPAATAHAIASRNVEEMLETRAVTGSATDEPRPLYLAS